MQDYDEMRMIIDIDYGISLEEGAGQMAMRHNGRKS
jgi:hypothetical protein